MSHELWLVKNRSMINITPIVGNIAWRSHVDELSVVLDFEVAHSDTKLFPVNPVELGNLVILKNKEEITRGVIFTENQNGRSSVQYTSFDYSYYLNKSKAIYQFNKIRADQAIRKMLTDFKVPIGHITSIPTLVNKIYPNDAISDIIKDILEQAKSDLGQKYRMEMNKGKLNIEKQSDLIVSGTFKLASNLGETNIVQALGEPSRTRSIEEMKNKIQITHEDKLIFSLSDDELINSYGLLQEVHQVDKKDVAKAKNMARNLLKELGKVFESGSVPAPGDDRVRAGRILEIEEPITGMKGLYKVNGVNHTVSNGVHLMDLELGMI